MSESFSRGCGRGVSAEGSDAEGGTGTQFMFLSGCRRRVSGTQEDENEKVAT